MGLEIGLFNNGKSDKIIGENGSELLIQKFKNRSERLITDLFIYL